eukprot:Polyplicarium_translucidae@DN2945_c0_g1_i1.p1
MQQAPTVYRAFQAILGRVFDRVRNWIGSSSVHLGDHNVPNALMLIDKYLQVPTILAPIVLCIEKIPRLCASSAHIKKYIENQFGGEERLIKTILCDFFKHGFDGSGGDNFYDAGSCIDGRLTSTWNWCNCIEKKDFFSVFLLTGFVGFDAGGSQR